MKSLKLSLAAAIAVGAFSTSALATPLDQVIKDVDFSGYLRIRYTDLRTKVKKKHQKAVKDDTGSWNFKSMLNFKAKIDDYFFAVASVRFLDTDYGTAKMQGGIDYEGANSNNDHWDMYNAYIGAKYEGSTLMVGRWDIGSFFTDDMYGDGVKFANSDIEGLTLGGFFADALENDPDIESTNVLGQVKGKASYQHNMFGASLAGSYDPFNFEFNYGVVQDVANMFEFGLGTNFEFDEGLSFGLEGQYAFTTMNGGFNRAVRNMTAGLIETGDSNFYAAQLSTNLYGLEIAGGYINFSTDEDKLSMSSFEDNGHFIAPGEELLGYAFYAGKNQLGFGTIKYTIPDTGFSLGVDYLAGNRKIKASADRRAKSHDMSEVVAKAEYKYSDKLRLKTYWSHVKDDFNFDYDTTDGLIGKNTTQDKIRFEAKYLF